MHPLLIKVRSSREKFFKSINYDTRYKQWEVNKDGSRNYYKDLISAVHAVHCEGCKHCLKANKKVNED